MEAFRDQFSGNQKERKAAQAQPQKQQPKKQKAPEPEVLPAAEQPAFFAKNIRLKVAKIVSVERNPESDKLYIEHLDDGSGEDRVIQSGLVPYLTPEQLLGKHIILADNLKPRKMRGVESRGMLLAADYKDADGKECVEVLSVPWAAPGTNVVLEGDDVNAVKPDNIEADMFFSIEINVVDKSVEIGGKKLTADGKVITTEFTVNGGVH